MEQGELGDHVPPEGDSENPILEKRSSKKGKKKKNSEDLAHESLQSGAEDNVLQGVLSFVPESSMVRGGLAPLTQDSTFGPLERRPLHR